MRGLEKPDYATLHLYLDAIVANFINTTGKLPSQTTVIDLLTWTNQQQQDISTPQQNNAINR